MDQIFLELGIVIIVATSLGYLSRLLRQPMIPAYIVTGLLIGPYALSFISDTQLITTFAEIGIAFLLFVVGLELDFKRLKDIGMVASVGATFQIFVLFCFGYFIGVITNAFTRIELIYLGIIFAFSSTMVVVKLLSDKQELDTLHGRIVIGILLMQDIFAILALSVLGTLQEFALVVLMSAVFKAVFLLVAAVLISRYVFPALFRFAAHSQELLFLLSITTCFLFAIIVNLLGFSIAIGGFLAGVTLANLPYNLEIIARVKPLRDFFSPLFFVALGMEIPFDSIGRVMVPFIVFLLFIVIMKPFLIMAITALFGYTRRTSFLTGISLAQISEFSLIIAAHGLVLGQISAEIVSLAVLLAGVSISLTTYFIKYDNAIYHFFSHELKLLDQIGEEREELKYLNSHKRHEVILIGYDRIGYSVARTLKRIEKNYIVVDYNPDIIKRLIREKIPCMYGDIGDLEIIQRLNLHSAETVISTIPDVHDNLLLIKKVKQANEHATIFVTAGKVDEALELYDFGADYVILPHFLGGDHMSVILEEVRSDVNKIIGKKLEHIDELRRRKELGHEHPHHRHKNGH
jgi:Kef-type K+ transport system membrane component KefB